MHYHIRVMCFVMSFVPAEKEPERGRISLDRERVEGLMQKLAVQINTQVQQAALGINRVVNANMERAIRTISLERGYDPRLFTLVAFGGAGPMHACELAQELGIPRVLVPPHPGILSALGVATSSSGRPPSRQSTGT